MEEARKRVREEEGERREGQRELEGGGERLIRRHRGAARRKLTPGGEAGRDIR